MKNNQEMLNEYCLAEDTWLGEVLGLSVWQAKQNIEGGSLSGLSVMGSVFSYAKIATDKIRDVSYLSDLGFRPVDVALTYDNKPLSVSRSGISRFAVSEDREAVRGLASKGFVYSRFHLDPFISDTTANIIKRDWAGNFFDGNRGDGMVVAELNGNVVGFLQLIWGKNDCLVIDLIAVDSAFRNQGIGRDMIAYASLNGTGNGQIPVQLRVGTQAANIPSVRFYESLGFRLVGSQYVLHYHGNSQSGL